MVFGQSYSDDQQFDGVYEKSNDKKEEKEPDYLTIDRNPFLPETLRE